MPHATGSLWLASAPARPARPPLAGRGARADVAVLGAGIAGLTAAYLLAREGVDVVVLEAARIGAGATGHTTAKVTAAHGLRYADLRRRHGASTAAAYAELNGRAIDRIAQIAAREGIDCGWRRRDAYTYTADPARVGELADEAAAAREAGLDAELVTTTPLPFTVHAAVRVRDQAELHPVEWLEGLADAAERAGARIHEDSRALTVSRRGPCRIRTARGELTAERVIVATHHPTLDRGLMFARVRQQRSYLIAVRSGEPAPVGMFLSADSPTRSVRSHEMRDDGREILLVGGEGHVVGEDGDTGRRYAALEAWAREHFGVRAVEHRWSAQDPMPPDGLPYVGRLVPGCERVLVATAFGKWGMTAGTAAAQLLRDRILERTDDRGASWSPGRIDPRAAVPTLVRENASVARHVVADRLAPPADAETLAPGCGAIVRRPGARRAAAFRDDAGALHVLGSSCTHLGCEVRFNPAERSWDCPCHGSRFDAVDGSVLEGPAVHPLPAFGAGARDDAA